LKKYPPLASEFTPAIPCGQSREMLLGHARPQRKCCFARLALERGASSPITELIGT
jgi:hypothetical protein